MVTRQVKDNTEQPVKLCPYKKKNYAIYAQFDISVVLPSTACA